MNNSIKITESKINYSLMLINGVFLLPFSYLFYVPNRLFFYFFLVLGLFGLLSGLIGLVLPGPYIVINQDNILIKLADNSSHVISWNEVKAVGYFNYGLYQGFAFIFKDKNKYIFNLKLMDKRMLFSYEVLKKTLSEKFSGSLLINVNAVGEKNIDKIINFINQLNPNLFKLKI